jgi:DNA repair exonuclease SbcCD nuclease subunit
MTKFLHTADWQLGMTRHFLSDEAQARFTAARIETITTVGALAVEEGCSFVVVAGDVFESNQVERQVVVRSLEAMKATPGVTFYLLPGNHDPLDAASVFRSKSFVDNRPDNVVVLESSEPVLAAEGVEVVGAPWSTWSRAPWLICHETAHYESSSGTAAPTASRLTPLTRHSLCCATSKPPSLPAPCTMSL